MATQTVATSTVKRKAPTQAKAEAIAKAKAVAPDLAVRIGSTPKTKFRGDPNVFGRLVEDHDRHGALLAMIHETEGKSTEREALFTELGERIRDVRQGPDGALYLVSDGASAKIYRVQPA